MSGASGVKNRFFLKAVAVLLLVLWGAMMFRNAPRHYAPAKQDRAAAVKPPPALPQAEKDRFRHAVPFEPIATPAPGAVWVPGTAGGGKAWLDTKTGLVWGPMLENLSFKVTQLQQMNEARAACARAEPAGAWALPLGDEFDKAGDDGMKEADRGARRQWFAYTYAGQSPFVTVRMWDDKSLERVFYVRCVAKAE